MKGSPKTYIIAGLCFILILFLLINNNQQEQNTAMVIFSTPGEDIVFHCSIADDEESRRKGLIGISELDNDSGMLFIYSSAQSRVFTMKQMLIPLDIIFIDDQNRVIHIVEAEIDDLFIESNGSAQYVVEINYGLAEQYHLSMGTQVNIIIE